MSVMIERDTGLIGTMVNFKVMVNGEKVDTIKHAEVLELDLPEKEAILQFSQTGIKTNEIYVKDGDRLAIFTRSWTLYIIFAFFVLFAFVWRLAPRVISVGFIALYVGILLLANGFIYDVKKVSAESTVSNRNQI